MEFKKIVLSVNDEIAHLKLNSPENLNALNRELTTELLRALDFCGEDTSIRVLIISGEGRSFCSGGDLKAFSKMFSEGRNDSSMAEIGTDIKLVSDVARRIRRLQIPVIAAIHGSAAGAGCNLALMCDFKIASEEAKFIEAFVHVGLIPDMGGTYVLSRYLGLSHLNEALMLGKPITASEALSRGMINKVVPFATLENEALELAAIIKTLPSLSLAKIKSLVNKTLFTGLDAILEVEEEYQVLCAESSDFHEGVMAFMEKRKPNFK